MLFGTLGGVLILANGCAMQPMDHHHGGDGHRDGRFRTIECNGNCPVTVDIMERDGVCYVVDPGVQHVGPKAKASIIWQLKGDYVFPSNGVVIHNNPPDFRTQGPVEQNTKFIIHDENRRPGYYKYEINVNRKNGRPCAGVDPGVINDGCDGC
ncbi:MAG: hypothetical protein ACM3SO_11020 [Betaproteobacteria bacterium]